MNFADTNIVVYALVPGDPERRRIARTLIQDAATVVSTQVLVESTSVLTGKYGFAYEDIPPMLYPFIRREILPTTAQTVARAWEIAIRYRFHIYDATLIAAALSAGCDVLYTEDLQHGQTIEGLRIVNPFV